MQKQAETLATRQNQTVNIERLAAMRELYSKAKHYNLLSAFVNIIVMVGLMLFVLFMNSQWLENPINLSWLLVLISFFILIFDELISIPKINSARKTAAKIQELFDCDVLQIPWNNMAGDKPEAEIIKAEADKHLAIQGNKEELENWYGNQQLFSQIPAQAAKLIAQRSNITWDKTLRQHYLNSLKKTLIIIILIPIIIGSFIDLSMQSFLIIALATVMPAISYLRQQYREHQHSLKALEHLSRKQTALWEKLLNQQSINDIEIRQLQDEIYNHRKNGALVFDRLYQKMKKSQEDSMYYSCEQSINEYQKSQLKK